MLCTISRSKGQKIKLTRFVRCFCRVLRLRTSLTDLFQWGGDSVSITSVSIIYSTLCSVADQRIYAVNWCVSQWNGRETMDVIFFFHITSRRINKQKGVNQLTELFFLIHFIFLNIHLRLTNHGYFIIKKNLFFTIHNKNGVLLQNFKCKWPHPESDQSTGNPLFTMTTSQRACKPVMTTRAFSRRNQHRVKALYWKSVGRKRVLVMLGYHSIQQMLSIQHDKSDFGRNTHLTERRTSSANHLFIWRLQHMLITG